MFPEHLRLGVPLEDVLLPVGDQEPRERGGVGGLGQVP